MPAWKINRRRPRRDYGLRKCPVCGRYNGWLQRGYLNVCAIGTGCRKGGGTVIGRGQ